MEAFTLLDGWPVDRLAAAVVAPSGSIHRYGDTGHRFRLASISKMLLGRAALVAVEEATVALDEPVGDVDGFDLSWCTLRHLLAHTSGLGFETTERLAPPATRRIYSNVGIELAGRLIEHRSELPIATYLGESVFDPLGMRSTTLEGSVAAWVVSTVDDLTSFIEDLRSPRLVAAESHRAYTHVQFPGIPGVVPGIGRYDDCAWGLTTEIRSTKSPHWMGTRNSPATFGHFGGAGTLLWVDPVAEVACVVLTETPFGPWALQHWPVFADAVLDECADRTP